MELFGRPKRTLNISKGVLVSADDLERMKVVAYLDIERYGAQISPAVHHHLL
jgi:hypothetical protein